MLLKNEVITAEIIDIASDANGVAKYDNITIFVPGTAVGDVCKIRIVKVNKNYLFGKCEEIITPSKDRQKTLCPIFNLCGGCDFFHINFEAEQRVKHNIVKSAFEKIGKSTCEVLPILSSKENLRYRNKSQFPVRQDENGRAVYGFFAKRSHRIIPCDDCLLQPEIVNEIAQFITERMNTLNIKAYDEETQKGDIKHIYTRIGAVSGEIMVCLVSKKANVKNLDMLVEDLIKTYKDIKTVVLNINSKNTNVILGSENINLYSNGIINDTLCGINLEISPHSFYQVNHDGAQQIYTIAKESLNLTKEDVLLDMYCGTGSIGLSMVSEVKQLIGVEIIPQAIENAKKTAKRHNIDNATFICSDAKDAAKQLVKDNFTPSVVVLDPPRKGCDNDTLEAVISMNPKKIMMISCNPATAARDSLVLNENGYKLEFIRPFNLFPRTKHVECICLFVKNEI